MHSKWVFKHFYPQPQTQKLPLFVLWGLSLLAGILLCTQSAYDLDDFFISTLTAPPSIVGKFLACTLPIGVTAVALLLPVSALFYFVVFLHGISYGFCGCIIYIVQGSAAWLLRPLLLFPAHCSSLLIWWLILQYRTAGEIFKRIHLAGILSCIAFFLDMFVVSPLLGDLIKYF